MGKALNRSAIEAQQRTAGKDEHNAIGASG